MKPPRASRGGHALPRWVTAIFFVSCLALIPQIIHLSGSLNRLALANHWRTVWVGFDTFEAIVFLLTAWFLFRGSARVSITASMAAAMLWMDAWFDVLTSVGRHNIIAAANLAVLLEIPVGAFCLYVALRTVRSLCTGDPGGPDGEDGCGRSSLRAP